MPARAVLEILNERTLFSTQWQLVKGGESPTEYERQMRESAYPALERLKAMCLSEKLIQT